MQSGGGCKKTMVMITNQNGFETQPNQKGSLVVNCPLLTTAAAAPRWQRRRPGTGGKLVVVAVKGGDGGGNSCWSLPPRDKSVREALLPTSTNSFNPMKRKTHWNIGYWNIGTFDIQLASIIISWHQLYWYCLSKLEWHFYHFLHQWTEWKSEKVGRWYIIAQRQYKSSCRS